MEVPAGHPPVPYGVGAQLGGDQRQPLVDVAVVGVAPGVQAVRDEQPGQAGARGVEVKDMANSVASVGPGGGKSEECMGSALRPCPARHQQGSFYGGVLYDREGAGTRCGGSGAESGNGYGTCP
ncbi:hypothetical protein GCM10020295_13270 [Streptomyces cinereospinus]